MTSGILKRSDSQFMLSCLNDKYLHCLNSVVANRIDPGPADLEVMGSNPRHFYSFFAMYKEMLPQCIMKFVLAKPDPHGCVRLWKTA